MPYDPNSLSPDQLEYARRLQAGLASTDPMAGALANNGTGGATPPPEGQPPAPPPTATDAGYGGAGGGGGGPEGYQQPGQAAPTTWDVPATAMRAGAGGGSGDGGYPMVPSDDARTTERAQWEQQYPAQAAAQKEAEAKAAAAAQAEPEQPPQQPPAQGGGGGGGYSPAQVIPGGPRVAGWNVTESRGPQTPYELRQAYSDSMGQMQDAGRKQAAIDAQRAEFSAGVARDNAEAERRFLLEQARIRQAADKAAATDRVQGPAEQLGTGGVIAAAILMGIGEYAARRPGGSGVNTAMNLINSQIDKEMQRQAKAIDIRRMGREEQALRLANMRSSYYEVMKQKVAAKAAELGTEEAAINGQKLTAQLDLEHNKYETDAARLAMGQTQVATSIQNVAPRVVGGGGPAPSGNAKVDPETFVPELGGYARTKDEAKDLRRKAGLVSRLQEIKGRQAELTTTGNRLLPGQHDKEYQALVDEAKTIIPEIYGWSGREMAYHEGTTKRLSGDGGLAPSKVLQIGSGAKPARAMVDREMATLKRQVTPGQERTERNAKGELAPVARYGGTTQSDARKPIKARPDEDD